MLVGVTSLRWAWSYEPDCRADLVVENEIGWVDGLLGVVTGDGNVLQAGLDHRPRRPQFLNRRKAMVDPPAN